MFRLFIFVLPFLFLQCPFVKLADDITFKVISASGGHLGYYNTDNGDVKFFEGGAMINGVSIYEVNVGPVETLMVSATTKTGATSIAIKVYKGPQLAKEEVLDNISQESTIGINYLYGEEPANPAAP